MESDTQEFHMTRDDWRELVFWIAASGVVLTTMLLCFATTDLVVRLLEMVS